MRLGRAAVYGVIASALCAAACGGQPDVSKTNGTVATASERDPWIRARERGIDFRAVGQEPGWYVEIDHAGTMHLVWDYAEHELTLPAPSPVIEDRRTRYTAAADGHRLAVSAETLPCRDGMSGQPFPLTVIVTIDERELRGCGRALGTEQSSWRAEATRVGPFRVGMSRAEIATIPDNASSLPARAPAAAGCELVAIPGTPGVALMFIDDRIARIDIIAPGVPTDAGVEVGMREERVTEAYGTRLTITPHKYVDGHYLALAGGSPLEGRDQRSAPDSTYRIVFETEDGWVTRYRVGRLPEVEWVEACG